MTRRCPVCEKYLEEDKFYSTHKYCKNCLAEYSRNEYNKRTEWIRELKSKPCMDCGKTYHYVMMQFDHRDGGTKLNTVSRLITGNRKRELVEAEIAKCDLVCSNCHSYRSWLRLQDIPLRVYKYE